MQDNENKSLDGDEPDADSSTLGHTLKAAREDRELSVEQIAAELRVEPHLLQALEDDDLEAFSAPVFTKGYLRQYANRLGLDPADLLAQYYQQVKTREVPVVPNRPIRLRDEQQITRWAVAVVALLLIGLVLAVWLLGSPDEPTEVTAPVTSEPSVTVLSPPPPEPETVESAPPEPEAVESPPPEPEVPPRSEPTAALADPFQVEPVAEPPTALLNERLLRVEMRFEEDCWAEITDGSARRLFYGLGQAGAVSQFNGEPPISFFLGNAAGVEILVNDRPFPVPVEGRQGNLARFVVLEPNP